MRRFLEFGWYSLGQAYSMGNSKLLEHVYFLLKNNQTQQIDKLLDLLMRKITRWNLSAPIQKTISQPVFMDYGRVDYPSSGRLS